MLFSCEILANSSAPWLVNPLAKQQKKIVTSKGVSAACVRLWRCTAERSSFRKSATFEFASFGGLLTSTIENFLPGLERWVSLLFDSPTLQDGLRAIVERKRWFAVVDQQEADQDGTTDSTTDGTVVIELPAAPEPTPVYFDNPEDAPSPPLAPADADEWPEMPEDLDRRKQIEAALLKAQPWLRHQPEKLKEQ